MNLAPSLLLILGTAVSAPAAAGQTPDEWKNWFDARADGFSGVTLVARGDAVQFAGAFGVADRAAKRPNTVDTRFNLGSINKTFTAIAIAQLMQAGRLSLDDTLAKHLPDYPNREAAAKITIQQLLSHRSGIAPFMRADFGGSSSVEEMTKVVGSEPLAFEPGARQEYSNGGYVVLGRIVEVLSGQGYEAYVADHIYKPAGMTSSGFARKGESSPAIALGYYPTDAEGHPLMGGQTGHFGFSPPEPGNPAGGGYSTASDLFRFARALAGGRLLDRRMTDYVLNGTFSGQPGPKFGFALREQMAGARRFLGNGGGAPGVNAEFRFEPAGDSTVVVLANSSPPAATQMLGDILERLTGAVVQMAPPRVLISAPRPEGQAAPAAFDRKAVVQTVADRVEELYVDPKIGKALAEHLRRRLGEGAFNSCASASALADALTLALREVADDKHLNVRAGSGDAGAAPRIRMVGPGPGGGGEPGSSGPRRVIVNPGDRPPEAADREPARSGVARVERLEGNVGYLALSGFVPGERNREALASAMNLLEDADALIVDVGHCPGGAPSSVVFLESYFFGSEPMELMSRYDRPSDRTEKEFTLKDLPGKRRPDVPVWIIAGPDTASACESFSYTLQKFGRATVVGSRTAGAGYNNAVLPVGDGLTLSVSVGKPMHPKTGGGWEATGVAPDIAAPTGQALSTAHREALKALLSKAPPGRRLALEWALESNRARESAVATGPLTDYSGSYGAREVSAAEGKLSVRSPTGRIIGPLLPVARDAFLLPDQIRIQFERGSGGAVAAFWLERPDGNRERFAKGGLTDTAASPCLSR